MRKENFGVYVGLEDWDRAFEWLEKAIEARAWEMPLLKVDPAFDRLRLDPRFPELLARIRLPHRAQAAEPAPCPRLDRLSSWE